MNAPRSRADDQLEAWTQATTRPVPVFAARPERRRRSSVLTLVGIMAVVIVGLVAGAYIVGGRDGTQTQDPAQLAASAAAGIATAPGVGYSFSIATKFGDGSGTLGIRSDGKIDFERRRFSGTADGGAPGATMLMFGGPNSGAVIIADGTFVKTEAGPWERQPDLATTDLDPFMDGARMSETVASVFAASRIDPAIRVAPCGAVTCQVVGMTLPPAALASLASATFGERASAPPPDLIPAEMDLYVDPSGFPVRMETRLTAGTTVTTVALQLTRLDPPPAIAPPIP
jgi:hypothetical protein